MRANVLKRDYDGDDGLYGGVALLPFTLPKQTTYISSYWQEHGSGLRCDLRSGRILASLSYSLTRIAFHA